LRAHQLCLRSWLEYRRLCRNVRLNSPTAGAPCINKVGPSPSLWEGYIKRSSDSGVTWSTAEPMPRGVAGPAKNKVLQLPDGAHRP
jgi:hypothetical protein